MELAGFVTRSLVAWVATACLSSEREENAGTINQLVLGDFAEAAGDRRSALPSKVASTIVGSSHEERGVTVAQPGPDNISG